MTQGILLSSGVTDSFMIKGVFKYTVFGQEVWITTTHICMLIVMLVLMVFAFCAGRAMKRATEVPTGLQNVVELIVEKLDGMIGEFLPTPYQSQFGVQRLHGRPTDPNL